jgi:hypothetical protein
MGRCEDKRSVCPPSLPLSFSSPAELTHSGVRRFSGASFAQRVDEAIARAKSSSPSLPHRVTSSLTPQAALALEDGEEWLALDEQGFEEMLKAKGPGAGGLDDDLLDDSDDDEASDEDRDAMEGVQQEGAEKEKESREDRKARKVAKQLKGMASKVEEFVQGRGAVDGAEFSE